MDKQGKLWQFFLLVKKQGVKSVGESNVIYHKAGPDEMSPWEKRKKNLEAVGFLQWNTQGRNKRSGATSILTKCPHCP